MDAKAAFDQVMQKGVNIALATSVNCLPNVRVVTFAYDQQQPKTVYFTAFPGNKKIEEFEHNEKVCFVSLPEGAQNDLQVRCQGIVRRSTRPLAEITPIIVAKMPDYQGLLDQAGDILLAYEIVFEEVQVTIGVDAAQTIRID